MEIYTIKLKTGIDIIGEYVFSDEKLILLKNPIELNVNPEFGIFAKQWNNFILSEKIPILYEDTYFSGKANIRAIDYYSAFLKSQSEIEVEIVKTQKNEMKQRLN